MITCLTCKYYCDSGDCLHPDAFSSITGVKRQLTQEQERLVRLDVPQCGVQAKWYVEKIPGEDYEWVLPGQVLEANDEYLDDNDKWKKVILISKYIVNSLEHNKYRRKITQLAPCPLCGKAIIHASNCVVVYFHSCDLMLKVEIWNQIAECLSKYFPGVGYRWLESGEVIRDTDEFKTNNGWVESKLDIGCWVNTPFTVRRKL